MNRARTKYLSFGSLIVSAINDYTELIKFRLTSLVVFTAVAAFIIASNLVFNGLDILILAIGGFCVAGASNALNQALEKDYDKVMKRTSNRPVASGRMTLSHAVMFAGILCLIGITFLAWFNVLTAFLGMLAFITYAFVYTPLKRYSSSAVFVGAIAGAMPMVIGVVAVTGVLNLLALSLFLIQFAWQYPHFWAIGYMGFTDYQKAGFNFVPNRSSLPDRGIAVSSVAYALFLSLIGIGIWQMGLIGLTGAVAMTLLGIMYLYFSIAFYRYFNMKSARQLMFSSLVYVPLVLVILIIDKL